MRISLQWRRGATAAAIIFPMMILAVVSGERRFMIPGTMQICLLHTMIHGDVILPIQNNPLPNEMYYKIQHIPSDRVIDPAVGEVGWDKGQFMLFDLTANGKSSHYSVNLDSWVDPDN